MTWQVGPIEGMDHQEIKQLLDEHYERQYGGMTGELAAEQRRQYEQVTACLDHQLEAAAPDAGGFVVTIDGHALTALMTSEGGAAAPEAFVRLNIGARAPIGRFAREGMTETSERATPAAASGGPGG